MDATSRCVIIIAILLLLCIIASRFIVDYSDLEQSQIPIIDNIDNIDNIDDDNDNIPEMPEFETVDTLFKPTQIPIISDDITNDDNINNNNNNNNDNYNDNKNKKIIFDQWYTINSIDWTNKQIRRMAKNKNIIITKKLTKSAEKKRAKIIKIEPTKNKIVIQYTENCWYSCKKEIDFYSSHCIYFELPEIEEIEDIESKNTFDQSQLFQKLDKMMQKNEDLRDWVQEYTSNQIVQIEQKVNRQQISLEKFWKDATNDLYDKLSPKLDEINNKVDRHQNTIDSIQSIQEQHQQLLEKHTMIINNLNNGNGNNIINHDNNTLNTFDWNKIESDIDNKIETAIDKQLNKNFQNLAQEIASEMSKSIINDDIIKADNDYISSNDKLSINWAKTVIRHSKIKTSNDAMHEYGFKVIRMLQIWDQSSIEQSYKPGDCTPLLLNKQYNPYITIELYQPIYITKISLYHYHSIVLSKQAINAAPKDFQLWSSIDGSKWSHLGNYTYNYQNGPNEQYFDINHNDEEYQYIAFRLLSNYGGSDYGCIYQIKVFGDTIS